MKKMILLIIPFSWGLISYSQKDSLYTVGCNKIRATELPGQRVRFTYIDTCSGLSSIEEKTKEKVGKKDWYTNNGYYCEYWDAGLSVVKIRGFYDENIPVGLWQEYYRNGHLMAEGICNKFTFLADFNSDNTRILKIKLIDETKPLDTLYFNYNSETLSMLQNLKRYSGIHAEDRRTDTSYQKSMGFPLPESLKVGRWHYYDQKGRKTRIEYYTNGRLIKTETY